MKRTLILISALGVLLISFVGTWLAGSALSAPANQPVGNLPSDLAGTPVQFPSKSGATIHGWFIPGKKGVGAIILMHAVRANRLSMLERARFLSRADYSVLLFDFQAHGESTGEHITFGYLESLDAQAAVRFLRSNAPNEKIGVIGVSLGGAAALLASPPLDVDAMVLEMVYPTINQAISNPCCRFLWKISRDTIMRSEGEFSDGRSIVGNDLTLPIPRASPRQPYFLLYRSK